MKRKRAACTGMSRFRPTVRNCPSEPHGTVFEPHDADTRSLATIQHERDDLAAMARLSTRPSVDAHHVAREKRAQAWVILG
jgi:hypothetical protein